MKQLTYLVLTIIILLIVVIFTLQNAHEVSVNLFFWNFKTSLALLIFSLFSLGVMLAIFFLTPLIISLKSSLSKDEKIISELLETKNINAEKETAGQLEIK